MQSFDLASFGILGTMLALVVEGIKIKFGTDSLKTKAVVALLAVAVGTVYVLFSGAVWWSTVLAILAVSQAVYALFLR